MKHVTKMKELEKLKEENESLKNVIRQLRKQLELYRKQSKKRYETMNDFVPYEEREKEN